MDNNHDLHGNAPDSSSVALLIIDMINDLEFEDAELIFDAALAAAGRIAELKKRARAAGIPVIYSNDNFGRWRSDFREVTEHVLNDGVLGQPLAELLRPDEDDYFVLKPKHSAFFATTMETLLRYLGARQLILTGIATDICVLFSANDAYMRDFELLVPSDCVAANLAEENEHALEYIERVLKADIRPSGQLDLWGMVQAAPAVTVGTPTSR
ncbi:MAG: isochorismatase family cysteine hydrolase [Gemmatimonadota bacterium]